MLETMEEIDEAIDQVDGVLLPGGNDVTMVRLSEAPEFTRACFDDLARDHLRKQRDDKDVLIQKAVEAFDRLNELLRDRRA